MFRLLVLSGLAASGLATFSMATPKRMTAECHLLELAYMVTKAQKDVAYSDILVDCPGYENWTLEMSTRDFSLAFLQALNAERPPKVIDGGIPANTVFERMIRRGVPVDIAQGMVETRVFDKAVADLAKRIE